MSANPYAVMPAQTELYPTEVFSPPPQSKVPAKAKTDWLIVLGGLIGLAYGFLTAKYPPAAQFAAGTVQPQTIGFVVGYVAGNLLVGMGFGWFVSLIFSNPLRAVLLVVVVVGMGSLGMFSKGQSPWRKLLKSRGTDPQRHDGVGRVRAGSDAFSLIPPKGFKKVWDPSNVFHLNGPVQYGVMTTVALKANAYQGPFNQKWAESNASRALPSNSKVDTIKSLTIDGTQAYVIEGHLQSKGKTLWVELYLIQGQGKLFRLFACGGERLSDTQRAMQSMVDSVRVD
jgi:hypothetical protein